MARHPLRLRTCLLCSRKFYSRSIRSKWCCVAHQVAAWRAANKSTHEELEQEFIKQEQENASKQQEAA